MEYEPQKTITLDFVREDGKHEPKKLAYYSLVEARNIADMVFRQNRVRYVEVEIRTDRGYSETLSNLYATAEDLQRI